MTRSLTSGLCAVVVMLGTASADPLAVRTSGRLPFSDAQLRAALAQRAALAGPDSADPVVAEIAGNARRVELAVGERRRRVELDGERGVDAARLVAFAILDLAGDQLDPPAETETETETERVAGAPAFPVTDNDLPSDLTRRDAAPPALSSSARTPRQTLTLWAAGGTHRTLSLEGGWRARGPLRIIGSAGISTGETHGMAPAAIALRVYPLRAGAAWRADGGRAGRFEARVTVVAMIEHASAVRTETGAVFGGGVAVAWLRPLAGQRRGLTALVGAGADGMITSRDYLVDGRTVVAGERLRWWLGAGIAGELWR